MRPLAIPTMAKPLSMTSLREKVIKIGAKVVSHGRYVTFQMAEVAMSPHVFANILTLIARLRTRPAPAWRLSGAESADIRWERCVSAKAKKPVPAGGQRTGVIWLQGRVAAEFRCATPWWRRKCAQRLG
jgi:hypothetical protein